jgi:YD repeat-containing protein
LAAYNLRNLPTTITYPGTLNVTRGYDDVGRLTSVQDWLSNTRSFGYDVNSNLTTETLPTANGVVDAFTFDAADRLTAISDTKGKKTTLFSATYARDNANQLTSDSSAPTSTSAFRSLEWIRARENVILVGPAGTGKSHLLVGLGHAAVQTGLRVRYFAAADLVETLYRGLADNSVGKLIDGLLRADLVVVDELGFAPLDLTGTQLLFRFIAAAYERRSLGLASHWPFDQWGRFLPEQTTATSMIDRLLQHSVVVVTQGESFRMREARSRGGDRRKR